MGDKKDWKKGWKKHHRGGRHHGHPMKRFWRMMMGGRRCGPRHGGPRHGGPRHGGPWRHGHGKFWRQH